MDYERASSQVSMPATLMMAVGGVAVALQLLALVANLLSAGFGALGSGAGDERFQAMFSGAWGTILALVGIVVNGLVVFGASKMKDLEGYPLAMVATILSILPCSCCCVVSLPIGIWSLVVLLDGNVKAAFRS